MHSGPELPVVGEGCALAEALLEMSAKGLGMTAIVDADQRLSGLFTDGDLRRALAAGADLRSARITELMTRNPHTVGAERLAAEAFQMMEARRINGLLVTDEAGCLIGVFNVHDLFKAGVV
jgi:arabinose-5-phosphate isomerase